MNKLLLAFVLGLFALAFGESAFAQAASGAASAAASAPLAAALGRRRGVGRRAGRRRRRSPTRATSPGCWSATALVIMMSIPGLALFYGGLVRSKNMLSVLMQVFVTFSMIVVLWCVYGYSLAFTEGNAFFGGFDRLFMKGLFDAADRHLRDGRDLQQGRLHPRAAVPRLPGDLRGDHLLPDRRRLRRAHEVRRRAAVHGAVVHLQLCADRPHGLVLDGPGRLQRQGSRRRDERQGRLHLADGRARLRRRHGRAHQRRGRRPGRRLHDRQAHRLRPRSRSRRTR